MRIGSDETTKNPEATTLKSQLGSWTALGPVEVNLANLANLAVEFALD